MFRERRRQWRAASVRDRAQKSASGVLFAPMTGEGGRTENVTGPAVLAKTGGKPSGLNWERIPLKGWAPLASGMMRKRGFPMRDHMGGRFWSSVLSARGGQGL